MKYLASEVISRSIWRLHTDAHPFVGITFLACKRSGLPVGTEVEVSIDDVTRAHLDRLHLFKGVSDFYFQPFKSIKFWVDRKYPSAGLQAINTQTFQDVFEHRKGSGKWGFATNYIAVLAGRLRALRYRRKPRLFDFAVWVYKDHGWPEETTSQHLVARLISDFRLVEEEIRSLFDTELPEISDGLFDRQPAVPLSYLRHFDPAPDAPTDVGGTLVELSLNQVGPVDQLALELGDRITLLTGDNGLGKSFLLECAWWAATGDWAHEPAYPGQDRAIAGFEPSIQFAIKDRTGATRALSVPYDWQSEVWKEPRDRQRLLALGVFSSADGSFSIYDPSQPRGRGRKRHSITLSQTEIWGHGSKEIEGIVRDWSRWEQATDTTAFSMFRRLIAELSPEDLGVLKPGRSVRVPDDRRDIPTIEHVYGATPIVFQSAGVKRILGLAYLITWTLNEHRIAAKRRNEPPLDRMIIVIDELESHLHPKWQRTILPALLSSLPAVGGISSTQIIVATHSPLVLASIETLYEKDQDRSYHFLLEGREVSLEELEYTKQGDISQWLTSPFIGLSYARPKAAEAAIAAAVSLQEQDDPAPDEVRRVDERLKAVLSSSDKFWPRWTYFASQFGGQR